MSPQRWHGSVSARWLATEVEKRATIQITWICTIKVQLRYITYFLITEFLQLTEIYKFIQCTKRVEESFDDTSSMSSWPVLSVVEPSVRTGRQAATLEGCNEDQMKKAHLQVFIYVFRISLPDVDSLGLKSWLGALSLNSQDGFFTHFRNVGLEQQFEW